MTLSSFRIGLAIWPASEDHTKLPIPLPIRCHLHPYQQTWLIQVQDAGLWLGQLGGIPYNVPLPKGKSVKMWSFADANLMHRFAQPFPKENCKRKGSDCDTSLLQPDTSIGIPRSRPYSQHSYIWSGRWWSQDRQQRWNKLTLMYLGVPIDGPALLLGIIRQLWRTPPHHMASYTNVTLCYHTITSMKL